MNRYLKYCYGFTIALVLGFSTTIGFPLIAWAEDTKTSAGITDTPVTTVDEKSAEKAAASNEKAQAKAEVKAAKAEVKKAKNDAKYVEKVKKGEAIGQEDRKTLNAVNQIDGVQVDPELFKEKKKGPGLNPIAWLFKPVIDMQKQVVHLEKQIMRLEGPIAGLQKPMNGLREDMVTVDNHMGELQGKMGEIQTNMTGVQGKMETVDGRLVKMQHQLDRIYQPIASLKEPIEDLQKPLSGVNSELTTLKKDLHDLKEVVNRTSTLILVAIVSIGLLVVLGTPIVAVFAWRHRNKIINKVEGPKAAAEEKARERRGPKIAA